jgi:pSer/pThr/pTyr-binding forkhead associated (FHA) protein
MEQTECSETSAYKIQTPGNYPEENIQKLFPLNHSTNYRYSSIEAFPATEINDIFSGQTAASRCDGFPTLPVLILPPSSGYADGLVEVVLKNHQ